MLVLAFWAQLVPAPDTARWLRDLPLGRLAVGFRSYEIVRPTTDRGRRTLSVAMWYPARPSPGGLRFGELFRLARREAADSITSRWSPSHALAQWSTGGDDSTRFDLALKLPMRAVPGAAAVEGAFPLVLWGPRHGTVAAQAPLSEVLASQGLVVVSIWSNDPPLAMLWDDQPAEVKEATVKAQADDLAFLAHRPPAPADAGLIVALAWSYGGRPAALFADREPRVRGVVSLDANVIPVAGGGVGAPRAPVVWFIGRDTTRRGYETRSRLPASVTVTRLGTLRHGHFNAVEGYLPALLGSPTSHPWSSSDPAAARGYRKVVQRVVAAVNRLVGPASRTPRRGA